MFMVFLLLVGKWWYLVLNGLNQLFRLNGLSDSQSGSNWNPRSLFTSGIGGGLWVPDITKMWQDDAGTIPVTTPGQPVGRWVSSDINASVALQTLSGSRPIYGVWPKSGIRNFLLFTDQLDDATWVKSTCSVVPNANGSADKLIPNTSANFSGVEQLVSKPVGKYTLSAEVKSAGFSTARLQFSSAAKAAYCSAVFNLSLGTISSTGNVLPYNMPAGVITSLPDGYWKISLTGNADTVDIVDILVGCYTTGNGTDGIYVRNVQFEANTLTNYQRVGASTYDVTQSTDQNLGYLQFDGVDDQLVTNILSMNSSDQMFVSTGVDILSSAANSTLLEYSGSFTGNTGVFKIETPDATLVSCSTFARGTTTRQNTTANVPTKNVIGMFANILSPLHDLRQNGVVTVSTATSLGTGPFIDRPLYIGARTSGMLLPFNGRIYGLVVCGKNMSESEKSLTDAYMMKLTGI